MTEPWQIIKVVELEMPSSKHLRFITFDMDDGKKFCYRSRTSLNAFFHSLKRRNWTKTRLYAMVDERTSASLLDLFDLPTVSVGNIWEFYELIGYEYKKRRFKKEKDE